MSLRARVLAGLAVVAAVLVAAGAVVVRSTERHLLAQVDERLRETGLGPARGRSPFPGGQGGQGSGGPGSGGPGSEGRPAGGPRFSDLYVAVVSGDGTVSVQQEPDFAAGTPLPVVDPAAVLDAPDGSLSTVLAEDGRLRYRIAVRGFGGVDARIVHGLPLGDVDDAVDRLVVLEVVATLVALLVLGFVGWWVVRLGVRPIKQMTATASAIAAGDLSARVPDGEPGTEAAALGAALNTMLDERARADDRLRRFVADASHELRTPVTTIRGYGELYRKGALSEPDELGEAMRRTEQEAVRMGRLVDDLVQLARFDAGRPLELVAVDLTVLAEDAARDARAVDHDRPVTTATPDPGVAVVRGDEARLRQVVANLVGNALVHTPPTAAVELRVGVDGAAAWLEVADRGPGMGEEAAARAFERFYREDPSRSRHRGGTGLGLSIVHAAVGAHGGRVSLRSAPGEGTVVRVELPVAAAHAP